jgi:hypothetical protein
MQRPLKLITRYDASRNEYVVLRHNLNPDDVDAAIRELSARLFCLFIVDQDGRHPANDPEGCPVCHKEVERSSHLEPKPIRRKS